MSTSACGMAQVPSQSLHCHPFALMHTDAQSQAQPGHGLKVPSAQGLIPHLGLGMLLSSLCGGGGHSQTHSVIVHQYRVTIRVEC